MWRLAPVGAMAVLVIAVGHRVASSGPARPQRRPVAPDAPVAALERRPPRGARPRSTRPTTRHGSWSAILSADVSVEEAEASGELPPPGGVDRALAQLDDAERMELARILRAEMAPRNAGSRRRAPAPDAGSTGSSDSARGHQTMWTRQHRPSARRRWIPGSGLDRAWRLRAAAAGSSGATGGQRPGPPGGAPGTGPRGRPSRPIGSTSRSCSGCSTPTR